MGRGQVVRRLPLEQEIEGSTPSVPAIRPTLFTHDPWPGEQQNWSNVLSTVEGLNKCITFSS